MEYLMLLMILIWTLNALCSLVCKRFGIIPDRSILSCGIVAYCGSVPANPAWIKMMMMFNDERGGDSTGWAVNNRVIKSAEKVSKFIQDNPLIIGPDDENFTLVAHARKASSGFKYSKELAHPFGIYQGDVEKEDYDIVLAMNGTLSNTDSLSKKWSIPFQYNTNSDTQMLTRAMAKMGWENDAYKEALELYDGSATLVFFNPNEPNTLMVYKDPDRPLYLWNPEEDQMYISSMEEPLFALGAGKKDTKFFLANNLYQITGGKIMHNETIVRTPYKPAPIHTISHASASNFRNKKNYNSSYEAAYNDYNTYGESTEPILLKKRVTESVNHSGRGNKVYVVNERYYKNGHPQNGKLLITADGSIKSGEDINATDTKLCFFINGYMCKSEKDYDDVLAKCIDNNRSFDVKKFTAIRMAELVENFEYPVITLVDGIEKWILDEKRSKTLKNSGDRTSFTPFLSTETFHLIYRDQWTKTTRKTICEIGEITKTSDEELKDDIMSPGSVSKTITFLVQAFRENEPDSPNYYHALVRKSLWKMDTSQVLKEHFFQLLIKMSSDANLITKTKADDLTKIAKEDIYCGRLFINEMETIVKMLKKKFREELSFIAKPINSKLSTGEKIKILETNKQTFTEEDVIKSITNCNTYISNPAFQDEIYHATIEFNQLCNDWIPESRNDGELREFYEAILLCLNTVQRVSNTQLLEALEESENITNLRKKAEKGYNEWTLFCLDAENLKEPVKENAVDPQLLETKDASYYQNAFQSEFEEILEQARDLHDRMANEQDVNKNTTFVSMENKLANTIRYIEQCIKLDPADVDKN